MKMKVTGYLSLVIGLAAVSAAFGQGVKITALPAATNVNDADLTVIVQSNVTKRATAALIRAGITGGTSDWNALSNRPSWITGATWQTNASAPVTTNASALTAGTLADARLSANVALLPDLGEWAKTTNPTVAADELGLGLYDSPQFSRVYLGGTNASVSVTGWSYEGTNSGGFNIGVINNGVESVGFGVSTNQMLVFAGSILFRGSQSWGTNEAHLALTRSNLRIPWSGVTNTNAAGWRADLGLGSWTTNASLTASLISDFSNAVVAVAPASTNASALTAGTLPDARLSTNVVTRATNGVAQASAWTLFTAPTNGVATIATNQFGVGWDELGRFSVNTPVGNLSMYATGSPSTATIFWPGTIVANRFSAVFFDSTVYASNIVGGAAGGAIADSVMRESMPEVLRNFMGGATAAGAAGVPYILTNASMQPVPGTYVPQGVVITNGQGNLELTGQWSTLAAFRTNVFTGGGVPAAGVPDGSDYKAVAGQGTWVPSTTYLVRQTTNGPIVTNGTTTSSLIISNVPAGLYWAQGHMLSAATAGRTWIFLAPNQVLGARNLFAWFDSGGGGGAFNSSTNLNWNNDGASGSRNMAFAGPLMFTNTATVSFNVTVSGATNTAQVLSNSFIFLRKLD